MAILEMLMGQILGNQNSEASPVGGLINSLFHGVPGGMNSSAVGSLPDLVQQFEAHGLGETIHSWISNQENKMLQPEQLQRVLGADRVAKMAGVAGMTPDQLLQQLSQTLPGLIDRLTPGGTIPHTDTPPPAASGTST